MVTYPQRHELLVSGTGTSQHLYVIRGFGFILVLLEPILYLENMIFLGKLVCKVWYCTNLRQEAHFPEVSAVFIIFHLEIPWGHPRLLIHILLHQPKILSDYLIHLLMHQPKLLSDYLIHLLLHQPKLLGQASR